MTTDELRRQTRRKIFLEVLSLVVPIASALYFSAQFIGEWSTRSTQLATISTVAILTGYWIWRRSRVPADISPLTKDDVEEDDDEGEGGPWWDPSNILLFLITAVAIVGVVVVGIAINFLLSLLVIVAFVIGYGPSFGDVTITVGAMLGVSFVLEFGVVFPLAHLWNLDPEADSESLDQFCPTPRN